MAMIPIEPVELGQLVVEDSDSDEEPNPAASVKNSSALQLVRTRIRRHLSQDSLSRRKGRSAVGCSQEEIQRRAELKRLMHKRIQEELRSEEGQEPPPSDISSNPAQHGAPLLGHLPGGGPRDNLEFSVSDDSRPNKPCASNDESNARILDDGKISPVNDENDRQDCRRASCPESHLQPVGQCFVRERNSLPQMPSSPDLCPRRLPSSPETSSLGSWRLSYSASQLDEFLGYVGDGTSDPGLEQEGSVKEAEVVYIRRWSSVQNCAVAETDISRPEIVHLYDMDISRQLVTRAFNTPADSQSHSGSGRNSPRVVSNRQGNSIEIASQKLAGPVPELGIYPSTTTSVDPVTNTPSVNPSGLANNKATMPARLELDTECIQGLMSWKTKNPQISHNGTIERGVARIHQTVTDKPVTHKTGWAAGLRPPRLPKGQVGTKDFRRLNFSTRRAANILITLANEQLGR
ncbi:hypothetical protein B0T26DRAFT_680346 [Lasiosphaeria miniovina]|uniref:Uncharacterized protein n=1 Tax=Lasiosphaeria miniovina TaxID=1954250 RepID=A0AA39ZZT9_9PEZI|nr:uncharacterized protein B0T26DRAFT_680346 [Lasiosphaeria miniovina]KAK0706697.1 hypothetical protein B0T26DRAFT_680346 [Lasiosphaeria miniovina]